MFYVENKCERAGFNLAFEQYVFDSLPRDESYFMLWQNANAVIVGRHQNTFEEVNLDVAEAEGIEVIRRLSGGGAVYHDLGNVNYTYIMDAGDGDKLNLSYFCLPLIAALKELGIEAELSGRNDVTVNGQKISGTAQYVKKGRVMHHGTVLFDTNIETMSRVLSTDSGKYQSKGRKSVRSRVLNLKTLMPEAVTVSDFIEALLKNMLKDTGVKKRTLTDEDLRSIAVLEKERYSLWDWNIGSSPAFTLLRERRVEGVGKLQFFLTVDKGIIQGVEIRGDYFGAEDMGGLSQRLIGCPMQREGILMALEGFPLDKYIFGLDSIELADILVRE